MKCLLLLSPYNQNCNVSTNFSKSTTQNFTKIDSVLELLHTDRHRHGKANMHILAHYCYKPAKMSAWKLAPTGQVLIKFYIENCY